MYEVAVLPPQTFIFDNEKGSTVEFAVNTAQLEETLKRTLDAARAAGYAPIQFIFSKQLVTPTHEGVENAG